MKVFFVVTLVTVVICAIVLLLFGSYPITSQNIEDFFTTDMLAILAIGISVCILFKEGW